MVKFRNYVFMVRVHGILRAYVYTYIHSRNLQLANVGLAQAHPNYTYNCGLIEVPRQQEGIQQVNSEM